MMFCFAQASAPAPLRVLIADGVGTAMEGLTALLSDLEGITLFGCAQMPGKVLALVAAVHPEVVILDLQVPGPVGLRTLRQIKHLQPAPVVIVLSHYELPPLREACLGAGADCFLQKTGTLEELRELLAGLVRNKRGVRPPVVRESKVATADAKAHSQSIQFRASPFKEPVCL